MHTQEYKEHQRVSKEELAHILISSIIIAFVLSFNKWGVENDVSVQAGLVHIIMSFIISVIILVLRLALQKKIALREGYLLKYKLHKWGVAASVFLAFFFHGTFFMMPGTPAYVTPGEFVCKESKRLRLGVLRYALNISDLAKLSIAGLLVSIIIMAVVQPIIFITGGWAVIDSELFINPFVIIVYVAAAIGIYSLLPIPGSDGFHIFYYKRWLWFFILIFTIIFYVMIRIANPFSLVTALLLAGLALHFFKKELD